MSVIEDMRAALENPGYRLDMRFYAETYNDMCWVCAGGATVVFGLGGSNHCATWSSEQWLVAKWCDAVRLSAFCSCAMLGHPIPESAQNAWDCAMADAGNPDFFPAWERFANALPTLAEIEGAKR